MSLYDRWKQAESHTKSMAREGLQRARESWEDTEQMIRRRMRLFPKQMPPIARPEIQDQSVLRPAGMLSRRSDVAVVPPVTAAETQVLDTSKKGTAA